MEVLRLLKVLGYKPKKTIRIVLFANAENATRGGLKHAEQAKANYENHHSRGGVFEPVNKRALLLEAVNMAALIYLVDKDDCE
ncbi:MAG: peptidase family protein [Segetibacter sp.]|nr:peptidase family protein [Segetibacter sp.]